MHVWGELAKHSICTLPMPNIHNKYHDFLLLNDVKKPVIAESITVVAFKFALEFFNIRAKKRIFSELWIDDGFYFEVELCIKCRFCLLKALCLGNTKQS